MAPPETRSVGTNQQTIVQVNTNIKQPDGMVMEGCLADNWKFFQQKFNLFLKASRSTGESAEFKTSLLLSSIGDKALKIYNNLAFEATEDKEDYETVINKFDGYFNPEKNATYERHMFLSRDKKPHEKMDEYITDLRQHSPGGPEAENYRNRKGFFSMNVQAICDAELRINNVVSRWPGSTSDAIIWYNSNIRRDMEFNTYGNDNILVGDSGYGVCHYLLTPLAAPHTPSENLYNESQIRTRNPIERCFGVLKRRFPVLALGIRLDLPKVEKVVVSTAILHNIAINCKDRMHAVDPEIEAAIDNLQGINIVNIYQYRDQRINLNEITRHTLDK